MAGPQRKRSEAPDLQRQVTAIAAALIKASPACIDSLIESALACVGQRMQADRCTLYLYDTDKGSLSQAYGWLEPGVDPLPLQGLGSVPAEKLFPACVKRLLARKLVVIPDLLDPPSWLGDDAERLARVKVRSLVLVPMFAGDLPVGLLGVDRMHKRGSWDELQLLFVEQVAAFLTQSLLRVKAERGIAQTETRYQLLTEYNQSILYELSLDGRYTYVAPNAESAIGYKPEELIGKRFDYFMDADDARRIAGHFAQLMHDVQASPVYEYRLRHKDGRQLWHRSVIAPVRDATGRITSLVCNALDVTSLRLSEAGLRQEAQLTEILVRLACNYINLPIHQLDSAIRESLQELGRFVKADRAYIFAYDHDFSRGRNTHEWCAEGITPEIDRLQDIPIEAMQDFFQPHAQGQLLYIPDVSAYPHAATRELLQAQGIVSLITMPMMQDGACIGFVGFDSVRQHRSYSDSEIRLLRVFAEMLVNMQIRSAAQAQLEREQRRLSEIIDGTDAGTWEWDQQSQQLLFNPRAARLLGYASSDLLPSCSEDWQALVHPQDLAPALKALVDHLKGRTPHLEVELRLRHQRGDWVWLLLRGRVVLRSADGRARLLSGIAIDINDRKMAEAEIRLAASVFTHSHEGILITDLDARIIDVNESFSRITGYARAEVLGRTPSILNSGRQSAQFYEQMWAALETSGFWSGEIWNRRRDGEEYVQQLTISTVRDKDDQALRYVGLFSDITAQKQYQDNLERLAHFDMLTGLPNRVLIGERVRQLMRSHARDGQRMALVYIDIDHFKLINDSYGLELGNQVLLEVATRLQQAISPTDTVARPGGDEFVLVLSALDDDGALNLMLKRLQAVLGEPLKVGELRLQLTASIGVTAYPQAEELEPDQLLRQADQAMYEAKRLGRNAIRYFDAELELAYRQRQDSLRRLRQAFEAGEFILHYQPKVNLRSGELRGVEALIRWQHPERGIVMPGEFLSVIEGDPLSHQLDIWVLASALRQVAEWQAAGLEVGVAVNVSPGALLRGNLLEALQQELAANPQVDPRSLTLEVVETSILEDIGKINQLTVACAELGVRFALDDFGTGFSSLSHLKHLPIRQLKVDQSFVRDMLKDPDDLAIIEGVVRLGQAFGLEVLAEGVETDEHVRALLNLGCELAQGYRIARPMDAAALSQWLRQWQAPADWAQTPKLGSELLPVLFAEAECKARMDWLQARMAAESMPGQRVVGRSERSRFRAWLSERRDKAGYTVLWSLLEQFDMLDAEIQQLLQHHDRTAAEQRLQTLRGLSESLLSDLRQRRSMAGRATIQAG